ncbi:MAG: rhomboid family intramembrane serine protease [Candidatus Nanohaloarchaea archaeon]
MAECSECGKDSMSFTCRYCGKKYCAEHRLPENHDCEKLDEEVEKKREQQGKWFQEKEVRNEVKPSEPRKPSMARDIISTFTNSATLSIITVTVFAFLLQMVPGFTEMMLLDPAVGELVQRPWSIITVMLVHGGLFHIFANMVTFYFFGTPLERIIGTQGLFKLYVGSGVVASIGFIVLQNLIAFLNPSGLACLTSGCSPGALTVLSPAVGASGAVVAVFAAVAMFYPDAEVLLYFFIPMKIQTALRLFAVMEGINLLTKLLGYSIPLIGISAPSAHLTGLVVGVWYGRKLRERHSPSTGVLDLLGY